MLKVEDRGMENCQEEVTPFESLLQSVYKTIEAVIFRIYIVIFHSIKIYFKIFIEKVK